MMRQGGCLCGSVRYQVEGEPISSGICRCRTCRKVASAPALPFTTLPAGAFTFTKGKPVEFRSSPAVTRSFCGRCGSPLTYRTDQQPGCIDVMTCSLDEPGAIPPSFHAWTSHKLSWEHVADGLPAYKTTRAAGERA